MSHYCGRTTAHGPHAEQNTGRCPGAAADLVPTRATARQHGEVVDGAFVYLGSSSTLTPHQDGRLAGLREVDGRTLTVERVVGENERVSDGTGLETFGRSKKFWAAPVPQPAPYERSCVNGAHAEATHAVTFSDGTAEDCCARHARMYHVGESIAVVEGHEFTPVSVEPIDAPVTYRLVRDEAPLPPFEGVAAHSGIDVALSGLRRTGVVDPLPAATRERYEGRWGRTMPDLFPGLGFMKEDPIPTLPPQLDAIEYDFSLVPVDAAEETRRWIAATSKAARWAARRTAWYQQERQMDYETARRHAAQDWKARQKLDGVRRHWISLAADLEVRLFGASPELATSLAEAGWDGVERVLRELLADGRVVAAVRHVMRTTGLRLREARDWLDSYRRWSGAPVSRGVVPV